MIDFNATEMKVYDGLSIGDCVRPTDPSLIRWVHVMGLHDNSPIEQIGKQFGIHALLVEDILNTKHRPKLDADPEQFCLILRDFGLDLQLRIQSEQVSIVVGPSFVLSFQEGTTDIFAPIRSRLSNSKARIRNSKSDFFGYSLIDTLIDRYLIVMEDLSDQVQVLEDSLESLDKIGLNKIYTLRSMMGTIQRNVRPLREAIYRLVRSESEIVLESTQPYLKDLYDHLLHVGEMADAYMDNLSNIMELHLLRLDKKTNETVKILTVVSTILMPLTFIASLFGMNFQNMPFQVEYGYPFVILTMVVIGFILIFYFRRRGWI